MIRFIQCSQIFPTLIDFDHGEWNAVSQQMMIHHEPGGATVAVDERMDGDKIVMKFRRREHGMHAGRILGSRQVRRTVAAVREVPRTAQRRYLEQPFKHNIRLA